MNINIVLDSDYICRKLSSENGAKDIENLFMIMKQKSNVIIIQDKKQKIINNIFHQLVKELKKENQIELTYAKNLITELLKGTNEYDFISEEVFENDISTFVNNLKEKNYPLKMIISDKNIDADINSYTIEDIGSIFEILESYTKKHTVTHNEDLLDLKKQKLKVVNFDQYKDVLFNTFWCSDKITIVAKEFFESWYNKDIGYAKNNRERYNEGFKFLFDCFNEIEKFTKEKLIIEIVTGVKNKRIKNFENFGRNQTNELHEFLKQISSDFAFTLKIIEWDYGSENSVGEGHGRRIYSDYGGLETGYMPFEIHAKDLQTGEISYKDTSFSWIDKESYINWRKIGNGHLLASRTQ
tara:strand:+ start:836 stop:1897 length:1062 start_codon:yes stop_codon:yes gene_type:complete